MYHLIQQIQRIWLPFYQVAIYGSAGTKFTRLLLGVMSLNTEPDNREDTCGVVYGLLHPSGVSTKILIMMSHCHCS